MRPKNLALLFGGQTAELLGYGLDADHVDKPTSGPKWTDCAVRHINETTIVGNYSVTNW